MNDIRKFIPEGIISSKEILIKLSKIKIREIEYPQKEEIIINPVSEESWNNTVISIHKAISS